MMSEGYVLIVSTVADVATDDVVRRLSRCSINHHRINTEDFPFNSTLSFSFGGDSSTQFLEIDGEPLHQPAAIWYRRMRSPAKPLGMQEGIYQFCLQESRAAFLGGALSSLTKWMSHPASVWQAEFKPFQLAMAQAIGFRVPRTVITNSPSVIREAFNSFGSMIVKPTRTGHVIYDDKEHAIFTSKLLAEHLEHLEGASLSPAIYQELIPKKFDIRVTVVGERIFSAAIDSQSDPEACIDWRRTENPELPHYPVTLPAEVERKLIDLMKRLGLAYGAIDLVQTPTGEYYFLEINPNGQWLWIDDKLDFGISDEVTSWLSRHVTDGHT
jgi:glutathione synthase/RimK-type ligase-like ATP-grasp enzyme